MKMAFKNLKQDTLLKEIEYENGDCMKETAT